MGVATSESDLRHVESRRNHRWNRDATAWTVAGLLVVTLLVAVVVGAAPATPALTIATLVPAAVIDVREGRLPDLWTGASAAVFVTGTMIAWVAGSSPPITDAALGALVAAGPVMALHLLSPASMGFGDVKAAVVIGAAVGSVDWRLAIVALTLAAGAAATVGVLARLRSLPFGPFLVVAAGVALLGADGWLAPLLVAEGAS